MSSFGNFLENELLDHVWGAAAYTAPGTLYIALSTTNPGEDGSTITEPAVGSYARKGVANNLTNWPAAVGGSKSNGTDITFVTATASWGVISHMAIFDAASGGNMLAHAALTSSKTIDNGDTVIFEAGNLTITLD